ncbi:Oxygen-independent coproporphyrinogen-III oxidase-like protein sll1917 [Planktothrix agardhii]|uniref:Heme chaperone HemW n=1 Tax=Planktothrix agardhii TaxID=1160 RepID=A0A1J1JCV4_PLAAG|nr:radical SAM family heme chaperone HemW [Planktothrix agardhii]CAD5963974.1 Oxygen-independent coproporphyrinogen-III oxidase-like protein sll1917 [Planktothrix agardhii]CUM58957.1 putative enzyme [Planktothrix agardhii]
MTDSSILTNTQSQPGFPSLESPGSAYLHIPFCRRRCFYCDFAVSVVGDRQHGDNSAIIQDYVKVLCQEIAQQSVSSNIYPLKTVFFGGGTPSLLSVNQLEQILHLVDKKLGISTDAEISMEVDPGTFDQEKLQGFLDLGVNRISLGVQGFQDKLLQLAGRSHTVDDIFSAINIIEKTGIKNWSLDLISGLPEQTLEDWEYSLKTLLKINPNHISIYDLIVEDKTPFSRYYTPGEFPLPTEESTAQMYRLAQQLLTQAGYEHYEISNYAKPEFQCQHNLVYWKKQPYYGFGMGAASYLQGYRLTRPRKRQEYYAWVNGNYSYNIAEFVDTTQEKLLETLMLGLRLAEGINLEYLSQQFGSETLAQILTILITFKNQGLVQFLDTQKQPISNTIQPDLNQGFIQLTDPDGFLLSNQILSTLFAELSDL